MTAPAKVDQYLHLGNELLDAGRFEEAVQAYRCALEQAPHDADALCNLGIAEMQLGHWADSAEATRRYLKLHEDDEKAWVRLGMCRKETGDLDAAREALERAIGLKEDDPVAWKELGVCCMAEGKAEEAIGALRRALAVKPLYLAARCELGRVHEQLGQHGMAMRLYMEGLQATPSAKRGPLYGRVAMLMARAGHWAQARTAYQKAISKGESDPRLPFGLGIACVKLGQLHEAREQRLILAALGSELAEKLARELDKADPEFARKAAAHSNGHSAAAAATPVEPRAASEPAAPAADSAQASRLNGSACPGAKTDFEPRPSPPQVEPRRPSARAPEPPPRAAAAEVLAPESDLVSVAPPTLDLEAIPVAEPAAAAESPSAKLDAEGAPIAESIAAAAVAAQADLESAAVEESTFTIDPASAEAAAEPAAETVAEASPAPETSPAMDPADVAPAAAPDSISESTVAAESESTMILPCLAPSAKTAPFSEEAPAAEATMAFPLSIPEPIPELTPELMPEPAAAQPADPSGADFDSRPFDEGLAANLKPQTRSWFGRFAGTRSNRGLALGVEARLDAPHERAGESVLAEIFPPYAEIGRAYSMRFALEDPRQRSIHIEVIQGKPLAPVAKCRVVTAFDLPIAPRTSPEANIEIIFVRETDEDLVRITVRDLISGVESQASASLGE